MMGSFGKGAAMLAALLVLATPAAAEPARPHYRVVRSVALGTPDRWDYLTFDPVSHRVFVAHGDRLTVVDGRSGALVGTVVGLSRATHGIGIVTAAGRGFGDDGKAGTAASFDLATLKPIATISAEPDADGIVVDPASRHVFVIDGDSGALTVIDPFADRRIATIEVGGGLEFGVADGSGRLYVNGAERGELTRIDTRTNTVTARWKLPGCRDPHGLAIDPATRRLFVSCKNAVLVAVDGESGREVARLPIGRGTDAAAFDPVRRRIFSANGIDGTISVIDELDADHFRSAGTIRTRVSARTMTIDPKTGRLYLAAARVEPGTAAGRRKIVPGSLALLFIDPVD